MRAILGTVGGVLMASFLAVLSIPLLASSTASASPGAVCRIDAYAQQQLGDVAGYSGEQLEHAATIMNVAAQQGFGIRGQQIGVMTAMEESTLQNLAYGDDAVNPDGSIADSLGLFQQQSSWGSVEQRMNPAEASRLFYEALEQLEGWERLAPHDAAHAVQRNAAAWRYAEHWEEAIAVVHAVTDAGNCSSTIVGPGGWALPSAAPITSHYGFRIDPISGVAKLHAGTDFSGGCGTPIYAAAAGTVSRIFTDVYDGWVIEIDHGGGITTWSVHSYANGIFVERGQAVAAGQQIAEEGSSGWSTGCHLHFEIHVDGTPVPTLPFLASMGVALPG